jgi:hypothetical protein
MNILALLNIIMAALAAVESGLQLAFEIITAAAVAAGITCLGCGPWCAYCCEGCYYAVVYGEDANGADNVHSNVEDIIEPIMDFTHGVAVAVRTGSPIAAQALVVGYSQSQPYSPVVQAGVMFPLLPSMQAEDDPDNWPCDEKVALPTLAIGEITAPIQVEFDMFNPWYAAGAAWGLARYEAIAREWCPDYFQHVPDDSQLGEDEFAIRTLMYGRSPHTWTRRGVAMADWSRSDGEAGWMEVFEPLTWISFAQSEYFFEQPFDDDAYEHNEYLWHQRWRARLRRFRLGDGGGGVDEACSVAGDACGSLFDLGSVVVH